MATYARNKSTPSTYTSYSSQQGWVQKPLTSSPLAYTALGYQSNFVEGRFGPFPLAYTVGPELMKKDYSYARAYDNLTRSIRGGQAAALGITLVQYRLSLDMIATRSRQISSAADAVRKGNIVRALSILNIVKRTSRNRVHRYRKLRLKDPAALWLELQFGWLPLYGDIYTACQVMSRSIPVERKYGTSSSAFEHYLVQGNYPSYRWDEEAHGVSRWRMGADVVGINPNAFLAANLGLVNPMQVAWDAVPFSFVIDWFIPVNKYLSSFDNRVGFELANEFTTHSVKAMSQERFVIHAMKKTDLRLGSSWRMQRSIGSGSRPSLPARIAPVSGSLWRAVTGVALAVTSLSKLR